MAEIASLAIGDCLIIKSNFMYQINFMDSFNGSKKRTVDVQEVLEQIKKGYWKKQVEDVKYHHRLPQNYLLRFLKLIYDKS